MEIRPLSNKTGARISSEMKITNFLQCVTELVFNSLDAKATAIAVRVNTLSFRLQVVDNGEGITPQNMKSIGQRHASNKCNSLSDLAKRCKYYGYRGEALASIREVSGALSVTSRAEGHDETFRKIFRENPAHLHRTEQRASKGTTVTVEGFLLDHPVRRKRIKTEIELEEIRKFLQHLGVIHPDLSLTLRNETTGCVTLNHRKSGAVSKAILNLCGDLDRGALHEIKVKKRNVSVSGLICSKPHANDTLQLVYVNKRPAEVKNLVRMINQIIESKLFKFAGGERGHALYVINIACPRFEFDWDVLLKCVEKLVGQVPSSDAAGSPSEAGIGEKKAKSDGALMEAEGRKGGIREGRRYLIGGKKEFGRNGVLQEAQEAIEVKVASQGDGLKLKDEAHGRGKEFIMDKFMRSLSAPTMGEGDGDYDILHDISFVNEKGPRRLEKLNREANLLMANRLARGRASLESPRSGRVSPQRSDDFVFPPAKVGQGADLLARDHLANLYRKGQRMPPKTPGPQKQNHDFTSGSTFTHRVSSLIVEPQRSDGFVFPTELNREENLLITDPLVKLDHRGQRTSLKTSRPQKQKNHDCRVSPPFGEPQKCDDLVFPTKLSPAADILSRDRLLHLDRRGQRMSLKALIPQKQNDDFTDGSTNQIRGVPPQFVEPQRSDDFVFPEKLNQAENLLSTDCLVKLNHRGQRMFPDSPRPQKQNYEFSNGSTNQARRVPPQFVEPQQCVFPAKLKQEGNLLSTDFLVKLNHREQRMSPDTPGPQKQDHDFTNESIFIHRVSPLLVGPQRSDDFVFPAKKLSQEANLLITDRPTKLNYRRQRMYLKTTGPLKQNYDFTNGSTNEMRGVPPQFVEHQQCNDFVFPKKLNQEENLLSTDCLVKLNHRGQRMSHETPRPQKQNYDFTSGSTFAHGVSPLIVEPQRSDGFVFPTKLNQEENLLITDRLAKLDHRGERMSPKTSRPQRQNHDFRVSPPFGEPQKSDDFVFPAKLSPAADILSTYCLLNLDHGGQRMSLKALAPQKQNYDFTNGSTNQIRRAPPQFVEPQQCVFPAKLNQEGNLLSTDRLLNLDHRGQRMSLKALIPQKQHYDFTNGSANQISVVPPQFVKPQQCDDFVFPAKLNQEENLMSTDCLVKLNRRGQRMSPETPGPQKQNYDFTNDSTNQTRRVSPQFVEHQQCVFPAKLNQEGNLLSTDYLAKLNHRGQRMSFKTPGPQNQDYDFTNGSTFTHRVSPLSVEPQRSDGFAFTRKLNQEGNLLSTDRLLKLNHRGQRMFPDSPRPQKQNYEFTNGSTNQARRVPPQFVEHQQCVFPAKLNQGGNLLSTDFLVKLNHRGRRMSPDTPGPQKQDYDFTNESTFIHQVSPLSVEPQRSAFPAKKLSQEANLLITDRPAKLNHRGQRMYLKTRGPQKQNYDFTNVSTNQTRRQFGVARQSDDLVLPTTNNRYVEASIFYNSVMRSMKPRRNSNSIFEDTKQEPTYRSHYNDLFLEEDDVRDRFYETVMRTRVEEGVDLNCALSEDEYQKFKRDLEAYVPRGALLDKTFRTIVAGKLDLNINFTDASKSLQVSLFYTSRWLGEYPINEDDRRGEEDMLQNTEVKNSPPVPGGDVTCASLSKIKDCDYSRCQLVEEWIEQEEGATKAYYLNTRTGMSSSLGRLSPAAKFTLKSRPRYIPKGLSPIAREVKQVDDSLPSSAKRRLQSAILEVYDNHLEIIRDSAGVEDLQDFLDKYYAENRGKFGGVTLSACNKYVSHETYAFTRNLFGELQVIGQLDLKFIVSQSRSGVIFLFDQHAVGERIHLERLLRDYTTATSEFGPTSYRSTQCNEFAVGIPPGDVCLIQACRHMFENLGLHFDVFEDHLSVRRVPLCFYDKSCKNASVNNEDTLATLVRNLIDEEVALLRSTRGGFSKVPSCIRDVINSEACRGAVKFGDALSTEECAEYIGRLSACLLPFHCAHGRPTVIPLVKIGDPTDGFVSAPNLKKLCVGEK